MITQKVKTKLSEIHAEVIIEKLRQWINEKERFTFDEVNDKENPRNNNRVRKAINDAIEKIRKKKEIKKRGLYYTKREKTIQLPLFD